MNIIGNVFVTDRWLPVVNITGNFFISDGLLDLLAAYDVHCTDQDGASAQLA